MNNCSLRAPDCNRVRIWRSLPTEGTRSCQNGRHAKELEYIKVLKDLRLLRCPACYRHAGPNGPEETYKPPPLAPLVPPIFRRAGPRPSPCLGVSVPRGGQAPALRVRKGFSLLRLLSLLFFVGRGPVPRRAIGQSCARGGQAPALRVRKGFSFRSESDFSRVRACRT